MTASTARSRSGRSASCGTRYGIRASRILALARTSRCAMVGAGTRKACAISSVESPPSVRSVRATCASVPSAGWQHVKIKRSRSSGTGVSSSSADSGADSSICRLISSRFCTRRAPRRSRSIALCRPVETSQATGFAGVPATGHCSSATANASCNASSATSMSPSRRISVARIRPYSVRKISSMRIAAQWEGYPTGRPRARDGRLARRPHPDGPHLDREARPHQRVPGGDRQHLVEVLGLDEAIAGQLLLRLGERTVRHDRLAVLHPHGGGGAGRLQRFTTLVEAARPEGLAELDGLLEDGAPFLHGHLVPPLLVLVDQQHVAHTRMSFLARSGALLGATTRAAAPAASGRRRRTPRGAPPPAGSAPS